MVKEVASLGGDVSSYVPEHVQLALQEISYDKSALQSLLDNLKPIAKKRGYEVSGIYLLFFAKVRLMQWL